MVPAQAPFKTLKKHLHNKRGIVEKTTSYRLHEIIFARLKFEIFIF